MQGRTLGYRPVSGLAKKGEERLFLRYKAMAFRADSSSFLPGQWELSTAKRKIQERVSEA
jgi:hypothetical protein